MTHFTAILQRLTAKRSTLFGVAILLALAILWVSSSLHSNPQTAAGQCKSTTTTLTPGVANSFAEYTMPHPHSDLMSVAAVGDGSIWFGEMGNNALGHLILATNTAAVTITEYTPPNGRDGIMGILPDSSGNIWFAEEASNYIGKLTPDTCKFVAYALPKHGLQVSAPNDLVFDQRGNLWFTEISSASIGELNPKTGAIHQFALPTKNTTVFPIPYGITVDHQGIVWFTMISSPEIGKLNPNTGAITMYPLATPGAETITITTAGDGTLWFAIMSGVIGTVNAATGMIHEIPIPASFGNVAQIYDLAIDAHGIVWVTSGGGNALLRFDPIAQSWQKIAFPHTGSSPYGLSQDTNGTLWVTEGSPSANRLAAYTP